MKPLVVSLALLAAIEGAQAGDLHVLRKLESGGRATIVAYGTSLTEAGQWVQILRETFDHRYPEKVEVINSGGSGQYSQWGLDHLEERVIAHRPDLVFIEFSVNDSVTRFKCPPEQGRANLEAMIERTRAILPHCEFVLLTTSPADQHPEGHPSHRSQIEEHHQNYRDVAAARGFPLVDIHPLWLALKTSDPHLYASLLPDGIHPTPEGDKTVVAPAILRSLGICRDLPGDALNGDRATSEETLFQNP